MKCCGAVVARYGDDALSPSAFVVPMVWCQLALLIYGLMLVIHGMLQGYDLTHRNEHAWFTKLHLHFFLMVENFWQLWSLSCLIILQIIKQHIHSITRLDSTQLIHALPTLWTSTQIAESAAMIVQPILIGFFIQWMLGDERNSEVWQGIALGAGIVVVNFLQAVAHHLLYYHTMKTGWNCRIAFTGESPYNMLMNATVARCVLK